MTAIERVARALYAYDNTGRGSFDEASDDERAPYYDLAAVALETMEKVS